MPTAATPRLSANIRDAAPAALLGCALLVAAATAYLQPSNDRDRYLVIAPAGWSLARTINLATLGDGRLIRTGRFANMLFVASKRPDFAATLRTAGAWLVLPSPASWGCEGIAKRRARA